MSLPVKQCTFAGGEVTPVSFARSDLALYEKSARTIRNMICMKHGGVTGRPPTMYVGTALNGGNPVRLIPFIFNETGIGQSYLLEFGNQYIAFYQNGGVVISAPNTPYTIVSPYLQADLASLNFAQSADILTIVHQNYPIQELKRFGPINWTITTPIFGSPIAGPTGLSLSGTGGGDVFSYLVSSVNANGEESDQLNISQVSTNSLVYATASDPVTVSWSAVTGAVSYRIYKIPPGGDNPGGYVGTTSGLTFSDTGIVPDFANVYPFNNQLLFANPGDYPATVGFVQQRRCFGNTINNPIGFWMSVTGNFSNFDSHFSPVDSDSISGSVSGEEVNAIQQILELKFMLIMTAGAEIYVQGGGQGIVTPSAVNASTQSQYGASSLKVLKVGDVLIFNQALGSFIRDFSFDFAIDGYRGNDISIFASHLFEGYQIKDWCYQKIPDSIIWAVRSDGVLLSCTYIREQQVLAWTHHDFKNGFVENICAIPENGEYAVYASIRRVINGSTIRYIERVSSRIWKGPTAAINNGTANAIGDPINASFCDCFAQYDGRNTGSTTMTLTASGSFLTDNTAYQQQLTLTASAAFFTSQMVGDQIFLQDSTFISSQGKEGNQIRCTIQTYVSSTVVTVTPDSIVPTEFQALPITIWAHAVKAVSGLSFLAGQKVSIWADRFVVGSPLNSHYSTVYTVPLSGILNLDKPYSVIYVGLPMIQDVETLDLETYFGETIMGRRKRMAGLFGYLYNTRTFYAGSENPDNNFQNTNDDPLFQLFSLRTGISQDTYDEPPPLITAQSYLITTARWNMRGGIFMRNLDPIPWTLLAVSPKEEDPVQTPYKRV